MHPSRNGTSAAPKLNIVLPIILLGITTQTPTIIAQPGDTFTPTGAMTTPRTFHTATLLPDGKVLIVGGWQVNPVPWLVLASAELYDASNGTFSATGRMTIARTRHTATLLPNGKVLIAGGHASTPYDPPSSLTSAELYDPSTGAFTATGDMTTGRAGHTATLLPNGNVLLAGGLDSGKRFGDLPSAELYDPVTGIFTATGSMTTARAFHTATLLSNGKVLLAGGDDGDIPIETAELYNPGTGTFSPTGGTEAASRGRAAVAATSLTNGTVLATMREIERSDSDRAVVYDPSTSTFSATGNMTTSRAGTLTLLSHGEVLAAGFSTAAGPYGGRPSAELYDPATGVFSLTGELATPRFGHAATLLLDGTVLMSGGSVSTWTSTTLASAELYHPAVSLPAPALLALSGSVRGPGAILHADTHEVVSSGNPAVGGETLEVYCTGLVNGAVIPPQVAIGGRMAETMFFGPAPGFASLNQVNVRVPIGIVPGPGVSVRMIYLSRPSNEVTIDVR